MKQRPVRPRQRGWEEDEEEGDVFLFPVSLSLSLSALSSRYRPELTMMSPGRTYSHALSQ